MLWPAPSRLTADRFHPRSSGSSGPSVPPPRRVSRPRMDTSHMAGRGMSDAAASAAAIRSSSVSSRARELATRHDFPAWTSTAHGARVTDDRAPFCHVTSWPGAATGDAPSRFHPCTPRDRAARPVSRGRARGDGGAIGVHPRVDQHRRRQPMGHSRRARLLRHRAEHRRGPSACRPRRAGVRVGRDLSDRDRPDMGARRRSVRRVSRDAGRQRDRHVTGGCTGVPSRAPRSSRGGRRFWSRP